MAKSQQARDFGLLEMRRFWLLSSLIRANLRISPPNSPVIAELVDELAIIALHTEQTPLREQCQKMITSVAGLQTQPTTTVAPAETVQIEIPAITA